MKHSIWYHTRLAWVKAMHIGEVTGCHQMPERSFFFRQYQFPVCARCCGVICGEILALIVFFKKIRIKNTISIMSAFTMFLDWHIQYIGKLTSTNRRRFITGILGGFGCWSINLNMIKYLFIKNQKPTLLVGRRKL